MSDLEIEVMLSADRSELRGLREVPDAADYEWRTIGGEARLGVPAEGEDGWLARGSAAQVAAVPVRWRHDGLTGLSGLIADLESAARRRRRAVVLGLIVCTGAVIGWLWSGLRAAGPRPGPFRRARGRRNRT